MSTVAALWRHPIKSHGREALEQVTLTEGMTMPWDRHWAVAHAKCKFDTANPAWVMCRNFVTGAISAPVAGIWATFDEQSHQMTLRHDALEPLIFNPDDPADLPRFLAWTAPLDLREVPTGIVSVPGRGITDSSKPTVSIMNIASHTAVEGFHGGPLERERWRGNIWLDGLPAWEEWHWIDHNIQIGEAVLHVHKRIVRCSHTTANPVTGQRDADTLGALRNGFGHEDFGINAIVTKSGRVALGDTAKVI